MKATPISAIKQKAVHASSSIKRSVQFEASINWEAEKNKSDKRAKRRSGRRGPKRVSKMRKLNGMFEKTFQRTRMEQGLDVLRNRDISVIQQACDSSMPFFLNLTAFLKKLGAPVDRKIHKSVLYFRQLEELSLDTMDGDARSFLLCMSSLPIFRTRFYPGGELSMSYKSPTLERAKMRELIRDMSSARKEAHRDNVSPESRTDSVDSSGRNESDEDNRDQVPTLLDEFH